MDNIKYNTWFIQLNKDESGVFIHTDLNCDLSLDDIFINKNNLTIIEYIFKNKKMYSKSFSDDFNNIKIIKESKKETNKEKNQNVYQFTEIYCKASKENFDSLLKQRNVKQHYKWSYSDSMSILYIDKEGFLKQMSGVQDTTKLEKFVEIYLSNNNWHY